MNKTRRHVNLGNGATWKTPTPCFSQCLKEIRLLRAHLWGTSWRESMRLVTLMCAARKKSDRRLGIRWRAFQWRSTSSNAVIRWRHFSRSLQCALMDSWYTSTQSSCSNASLWHQMPLTTERRNSVSALFDDTLMPRALQKAILTNAIWTRLPPDIAGPTGEVQHVLDGGALLSRDMRPLLWLFVMVTAFHPPSTRHINGAQATKSEARSPSQEMWSWRCRRMSSFRTSPTNITSSTCWVTTCSLLDASQNTEEDADLLIARTAVQSAAAKNTVLVADDTDLVILLCYYADPDGFDLFMQFSTRGITKKNRICDIKVT